jgi:hypothetical protein
MDALTALAMALSSGLESHPANARFGTPPSVMWSHDCLEWLELGALAM